MLFIFRILCPECNILCIHENLLIMSILTLERIQFYNILPLLSISNTNNSKNLP